MKFGASNAQSFGVLSGSTILAVAPTRLRHRRRDRHHPIRHDDAGRRRPVQLGAHRPRRRCIALSMKKGPASGGTTLTVSGRFFRTSAVDFGPARPRRASLSVTNTLDRPHLAPRRDRHRGSHRHHPVRHERASTGPLQVRKADGHIREPAARAGRRPVVTVTGTRLRTPRRATTIKFGTRIRRPSSNAPPRPNAR